MAKPKDNRKKPAVKMADLDAKKNPKGGRDAASGLPTGKRMYKPIT